MLAERAFYCSSSFRALFFGCQPGGFFMEQKHTLEENGYYAQVTDQLIENIGYQMIRRNWSMKTLADKAEDGGASLRVAESGSSSPIQ